MTKELKKKYLPDGKKDPTDQFVVSEVCCVLCVLRVLSCFCAGL